MSVALDRQIRPIYGSLSPIVARASSAFNLLLDALDTGSNKSAIVACNKLLKKHPKGELIKVCDSPMSTHYIFTCIVQALKALALVRSQKVEESLVLCDEVLDSRPTNDAVLTAMMHVLRGLGRSMLYPMFCTNTTIIRTDKDMVMMFEEAYKQQPTNEELGAQTFFANVRASDWKSAQQV